VPVALAWAISWVCNAFHGFRWFKRRQIVRLAEKLGHGPGLYCNPLFTLPESPFSNVSSRSNFLHPLRTASGTRQADIHHSGAFFISAHHQTLPRHRHRSHWEASAEPTRGLEPRRISCMSIIPAHCESRLLATVVSRTPKRVWLTYALLLQASREGTPRLL
jgi:hypothetical protein